MSEPGGIIVFDGVCRLCSMAVRIVLAEDRLDRFHFASLQSPVGARLMRQYDLDPGDARTMLLVKNGRAYVRSDAVIEIARDLPAWRWAAFLLRLVPRFIRDRVYTWIAAGRNRLPRRNQCLVPDASIRHKFLE